MPRIAIPRFLCSLGFCVLMLLAGGCRQEETRRTLPAQADSRIRAVQQAEMQRQAQQQQAPQDQPPPSQAAPQGGAQPAAGGQPAPPPSPSTTLPPSPQPYLPPSEQGAYVEMIETPAGSPLPPPAPPPTSGPDSGAPGGPRAAQQAGGAGGNMPAGAPVAGPAGQPPGSPPPASIGRTGPPGAPPPVTGAVSAPVQTQAETVGVLNGELERKLREFDELMKRAQAEADRERAAGGGVGARTGKPGGRGGALEPLPDEFGAGGAAEDATGIGASPDLSGQTSVDGARRRGPSAVRLPGGADDDIVARQLREAAEQESDPVLKRKLWDEYRNYKTE